MIHRRLTLLIQLGDGYTGRPATRFPLRCQLDGQQALPLVKPEGLLLFLDLPQGQHELWVESPAFQPERLLPVTPQAGYASLAAVLRPSRAYPFGRRTATLFGQVTQDGRPAQGLRFYLILEEAAKLAQQEARAGAAWAALFARRPLDALCGPGYYLLEDGPASEVCRLTGIGPQGARFAKPLRHAHARGTPLLRLLPALTDGAGEFFTVAADAAAQRLVVVDGERCRFHTLRLTPGREQRQDLHVEEWI